MADANATPVNAVPVADTVFVPGTFGTASNDTTHEACASTETFEMVTTLSVCAAVTPPPVHVVATFVGAPKSILAGMVTDRATSDAVKVLAELSTVTVTVTVSFAVVAPGAMDAAKVGNGAPVTVEDSVDGSPPKVTSEVTVPVPGEAGATLKLIVQLPLAGTTSPVTVVEVSPAAAEVVAVPHVVETGDASDSTNPAPLRLNSTSPDWVAARAELSTVRVTTDVPPTGTSTGETASVTVTGMATTVSTGGAPVPSAGFS